MAICFGDLPLAEFNSGFKRISSFMNSLTSYAFNSATTGEPVYINSLADLVDYSQNYDSTHVNDTLVISFADGLTDSELTGFTKIGTAEAPFDGLIKVAPDTILNLPTTMFAYITDDVGIIGTVSGTETDLVMSRTNAVPDQPLFAENVVHSTTGSGGKEWKFRYDSFNGGKSGQKVHDFAGYIGTLGENANIKVSSITHNNLKEETIANITASGDIGLVCQTMGVNSTLEIDSITIGESGTSNYSVSSTSSGNAGGLVGSIANGAKLILGESAANLQQTEQSITAESGYAGGIVGKCDGGAIKFDDNMTAYSVAQNVSGSSGSGAIAGYYNTVSTGTFPEGYDRYSIPLAKVSIASGYKANGTGNCGSYFGELNNDGTMAFALPALSIVHDSGAAASFGGLCGKYSAASLANTLTISSTGTVSPSRTGGTVANYGGLIGLVDGAAYVNVNGVTVNSLYANATSNFGGLIGKAQDAFVELTGTNTISYSGVSTTATFAGVVGDLKNGVLYLQGTTNLSGAPAVSTAAESSGQVVGYRDYALVFATDGWTMTRSSNSQTLDDVGSWGEIVRFSSSGVKQSDVLTIDTTNHYVTLKTAVTSMENTTDFVKTALNIQLNNGQNTGVLRCSGTNSVNLLKTGTTLSLKNNSVKIDLSGTGITGLTRDDTDNCVTFKGTFNGNGGSIKLATGESYFSGSNAEGNGKIYRHAYNGLFAKTDGATIQNLKIAADSTINVNALSTMYVGNVVGQATGNLTLTSVEMCYDSTANKRATIDNAGSSSYFGGSVGNLTAANTVNITGCTYNGEIKGSATSSKVGGIIGAVTNSSSDKEFAITIGSTTVGGIITATGNEVGGAIAVIESSGNPATYKSKDRTLKLNDLSISGLNINGNGGFLGDKWYETDVEFKASGSAGVTVSGSSSLTAGGTSAAGLVHTATGYWKVNSSGINLTSMSVTAGSATDFGLLVNTGIVDDSAIYLELAPSAFSVTKADVGLTLGSVSVFDELVAHASSGDKLSNGQGIVSIGTVDHALLQMGSTGSADTYQHKTAYLDSHAGLIGNPNTRYYYNLDAYKDAPSDAKQELLIWSVKQYAHDTLKDYFDKNNTIGTTIGSSSSTPLDMSGYSYYPVDLTGTLNLNGAVTISNVVFDGTETSTGDNRLSGESGQHYMMHNSLFYNVSGSLTFNGSLNGTVSKIGDYCGALVMCEVSSSAQLNPATVTVSGLELKGAMISGAAGPLLINKAGSNATISISNVSNDDSSYTSKGAGSSSWIATSLLGEIGSASSGAVNLSFSGIKLDGRNSDGVTALPGLTSVYHSNGCLFRDAILVDTLAYANGSGSYGVYNFTHDDDWGSGNRKVTYGSELNTTAENVDEITGDSKQLKYNDTTNPRYTHPDADNNTEYDSFGSYFKNYVKTGYNEANSTHELRVNVPGSTTKGCGTYNDPYMIRSYSDLKVYVDIINGDNTSDQTISVPTNASSAPDITAKWCNGNDITYTKYESGNWRTATGATTNQLGNNDLREYLAGAYYKIDPDLVGTIELPAGFAGISNNVTSEYVFRGVIDGSNMRIRNLSSNPLIVSSNGCVVYNLNLEVDPTSLKQIKQNNSVPFDINGTIGTGVTTGEQPDERCDFYGAVIGQIFGGDNIIDKVKVKFDGTVVENTSGSYTHLVPIGGYVGVVVNGGLIFREMDGYSSINANDQNGISSANLTGFSGGVGNTPSDPTASDNTKWLYINPIVGRVLNGYAITESTSYKPFEDGSREYPDGSIDYWHVSTTNNAVTYSVDNDPTDKVGVTMRNGTKNYSIADINKNDTANNFTMKDSNSNTSGAEGATVTAKNAQSLFIISLITESGLGTSSDCQYDDTHNLLKPYTDYMATHLSDYHYVGSDDLRAATSEPSSLVSNPTTDAQKANNDYLNAKNDLTNDTTNSTSMVPYLIKTYTPQKSSTEYPAFNLAAYDSGNNEHYLNMVFDNATYTTYYVPDGFRGLGCLLLDNGAHVWFRGTEVANLRLYNAMYLYSLTGNNVNVSLNMNLRFYDESNENYRMPYGGTGTTADGTTLNITDTYLKTGYGFFNALRSDYGDDSAHKLKDLELNGRINFEIVDTNGAIVSYAHNTNTKIGNDRCSVGGFIGAPGIDTVPTGNTGDGGGGDMYVENITLDNLYVHGMNSVGGMAGCSNAANTYTFYSCSADNLEVVGGPRVGGMIGYIRNSSSKIYADFNGNEFGIISIRSKASGQSGGLFGENYAGNPTGVTVKYVTVKNATNVVSGKGYVGYDSLTAAGAAGGVFGNASRGNTMTMEHVTVENIDIKGTNTGGLIGTCTGGNPVKITNCKVTTDKGCVIESTNNNGSGGFVGNYNKSAQIEITDSEINNYTISSTNSTGNCGGLVGQMSQNQNLICKNITVSGVNIKANSNGGGMVGNMVNGTMLGYNILVDNLTFARNSGTGAVTSWGYIAGKNADKPIKLAGFSRQGTIGVAATVGSYTTDMYGSGGYVVFADYNGTASTDENAEFANMQASGVNVVPNTPIDSLKTETNYTIIAKRENDNSLTIKDVSSPSGTPVADVYKEELAETGTYEEYSNCTRWAITKPSNIVTDLSKLTTGTRKDGGFYLILDEVNAHSLTFTQPGPWYVSNDISNGITSDVFDDENKTRHKGLANDAIPVKSTPSASTIWYFETSGDYYKIYTFISGTKKYLNAGGTNANRFNDTGTQFSIYSDANSLTNTYYISNTAKNKWLQYSNGGAGIRYYNSNSDKLNCCFKIQFVQDAADELLEYVYDSMSYAESTGLSIGTQTSSGSASSQQGTFSGILQAYELESGEETDSTYEVYKYTKTEWKTNNFIPGSNASPYVTTNPRFDITKSGGTASQWLTGDGVSGANYYGSAAYGMMKGSANKKYQATGLTAAELATLETRLVNNMTTIKSASTADPSSYNGEDFPVLVINDIDTANAIVNNYLKLLTNTSYDFYNGGAASVYNVDISKWLYSSTTGKFELQDGEAALKRNSSGFYITTSDIDNDKWQISLIDVQFYDPSDTTANKKIAYHVYVPVVVTKMLHYLINIRAASTTSYTLDAYPSSVQNLIENLGNPITMKITYTYRQTAAEWADAINNGESVYRNYDKTLTVKATGNLFPADSIVVLVDPNDNKDKYYTSSFKAGEGGILTNGDSSNKYELKLSDFSGFDLVKLNDLMDITATAGSGNLVECGIDDENLVCVVRNGKTVNGEPADLPLRYKNSTDNESTTYYTVSVALKDYQKNSGYVQENYYISIFTKENKPDTSIYHYEISSAANDTFGDTAHPSARIGGNAEAPHLFLGNLYTNDVTITEQNKNRKMDSSNNCLEADLKTKIGFTSAAISGGILDNIRNDNVKIFQTFMVSLNRLNGSSGNERGILVDPINIEYDDYTIGGIEPSNYHLSYKKHKGYIELPNECDIKSYLIAGATRTQPEGETPNYTVEIKETVKLTYAAGSLPEQFPKSTEDSTDVGTKMIGYSNISSTKDGGAASRASNNTDGKGTPLLYYIENDTSATFSYNVIANSAFDGDGNGNFGQLGVDGYELDESGDQYVQIKSAGLYDAHEYSLNSEADYVKISIKLSKKSSYGTALDIPTYLRDFKILDKNGDVVEQIDDNPDTEETNEDNDITVKTESNVIIYIVPKTLLESSENIYTIPIQFGVWSGSNEKFEDKNSAEYDMQYSNYKVLVTVGLLGTDLETGALIETPLNNSDKSDHIIYTNAKLYSEVIS